jgi:hypothetical protein
MQQLLSLTSGVKRLKGNCLRVVDKEFGGRGVFLLKKKEDLIKYMRSIKKFIL